MATNDDWDYVRKFAKCLAELLLFEVQSGRRMGQLLQIQIIYLYVINRIYLTAKYKFVLFWGDIDLMDLMCKVDNGKPIFPVEVLY